MAAAPRAPSPSTGVTPSTSPPPKYDGIQLRTVRAVDVAAAPRIAHAASAQRDTSSSGGSHVDCRRIERHLESQLRVKDVTIEELQHLSQEKNVLMATMVAEWTASRETVTRLENRNYELSKALFASREQARLLEQQVQDLIKAVRYLEG